MPQQITIPFLTPQGETAILTIYEEKPGTLSQVDELTAKEHNESPWQLKEGSNYEYKLTPEAYRLERSIIVRPSHIHPNCGRICTNTHVGSLPVDIYHAEEKAATVTLEVCSVKSDYRTDYRIMLQDITAHCSELLMQQKAPVDQYYTPDPTCDARTLYQRFTFVRSLIESDDFHEALHRIHTSPVRRWKETEAQHDICNIKRVNQRMARQLAGGGNHIPLPTGHPLKQRIGTVPRKITVPYKKETVDTPENRFVKHLLETFLQFCTTIHNHPCAGERLKEEARQTGEQLEQYLAFALFKDVSPLTVLPLNSPVLQRKEGYREMLQAWFKFDMAARLTWKGGDEVYRAGKKDVATLYEYWLFFKLLALIEEVFHLPRTATKDLIVPTDEGMELTLIQGKNNVVSGVWHNDTRNLHIEFHYNKTFTTATGYHQSGSWTRRMRPDYTLTIRPEALTPEEAERQEQILHIHFDAKYKVNLIDTVFNDTEDLDTEKAAQQEGHYKRADLLKMHAYKDAIHRTAGAYILYPGTEHQTFNNYHELLPGLGAFAIAPGRPETGTNGLRQFLVDVINHFQNRASQREKVNYHKYNILNNIPMVVKEPTPTYKTAKPLTPAKTNVLIAWYKNEQHKNWITANHLYNIRTGSGRGSLPLNEETTAVRYLLLHGPGESKQATLLYKIHPTSPQIMPREQLLDQGYPTHPSQPYYLVYQLTEEVEPQLQGKKWDITTLKPYKKGPQSAAPFIIKLSELLKL